MRLTLLVCLGSCLAIHLIAQETLPNVSVPPRMTTESINELRSRLEADPEDLEARTSILGLQARTGATAGYIRDLKWMIRHHPENLALTVHSRLEPRGGRLNSAADFQDVAALWDAALAAHASEAAVLRNGAIFFSYSDPDRAFQLFEQARRLAPGDEAYVSNEAYFFYAMIRQAMTGVHDYAFPSARVETLRGQLSTSTDAELLGHTAVWLLWAPATRAAAVSLLQRAAALDPDNPKWKEYLNAPAATLPGPPPPPPPPAMPSASRVAVITGDAIQSNLLTRVEPVYPELAKKAGVAGTVIFQATINEKGDVSQLSLIQGHPLLISAAREAVLQWKFRPTLLNDKPVPVVTNLSVEFIH